MYMHSVSEWFFFWRESQKCAFRVVGSCSSETLSHQGAGMLKPDTMRVLCSLLSSAGSLVWARKPGITFWPCSLTSGIQQSPCLPTITHSFPPTSCICCIVALFCSTFSLCPLSAVWLLWPLMGYRKKNIIDTKRDVMELPGIHSQHAVEQEVGKGPWSV